MLALATTTIMIESATEAEPGEGRTWGVVATGVAAQIGTPAGDEESVPGGGRQALTATLNCDYTAALAAFDHTCRVTDLTTDEVWEVEWVKVRIGLGLDHVEARLTAWKGGGR